MTVCSKDRISTPFLALFIGVFLLASCRKNEDTVGSDFVGALAGINVQSSDTSSFIAYTSQHDSFDTRQLSYYMLGTMNDPDFGVTTASIANQVDLPYNGYPGFANQTIDSIVLQLAYVTPSSVYGNTSTTQILRVYELNEDLPSDAAYSNRAYVTNPVPLGTCITDFRHMGDSVPITLNGQTVKLAPHLRIKLDESAFVSKIQTAGVGSFATSSAFKSFLKGFYIVPEIGPLSAGQGAVAYMNMTTQPVTTMVVYYNGTLKAEFPMTQTSNNRGNKFSHSFPSSVSLQPLLGGKNQNTCYVQPAAGLKTRILFPNLFDFAKDHRIAITGAEVIVTIDQTRDTSMYKIPSRLFLFGSDSSGYTQAPYDLVASSGSELAANLMYYGGYYSGNGEYRFNIQREVQYWFNQYKNNNRNVNYGLNLRAPIDNPIAANRVILDTRPGKIKLKLSYTVIN